MAGLRLGVDLDGVVTDFNAGWVERYNRDFGTNIAVEDAVDWDCLVSLTHFARSGEFWAWARTCGEGASLFRWLEPFPGALEAIRQLASNGHKIVILTTKPSFAIHDTYAWLSDHRVPTTEVHILDDKAAVDCDVYIDDAVHNLEALTAGHPTATVCRYIRPWNDPVPGTVDVESWDDIIDVVAELAR